MYALSLSLLVCYAPDFPRVYVHCLVKKAQWREVKQNVIGRHSKTTMRASKEDINYFLELPHPPSSFTTAIFTLYMYVDCICTLYRYEEEAGKGNSTHPKLHKGKWIST